MEMWDNDRLIATTYEEEDNILIATVEIPLGDATIEDMITIDKNAVYHDIVAFHNELSTACFTFYLRAQRKILQSKILMEVDGG